MSVHSLHSSFATHLLESGTDLTYSDTQAAKQQKYRYTHISQQKVLTR